MSRAVTALIEVELAHRHRQSHVSATLTAAEAQRPLSPTPLKPISLNIKYQLP